MDKNENHLAEVASISQKNVISLRALPELKFRLNEEAIECGLTLSEYCEMLLANRHDRKDEIDQLRAENESLELQVIPSNDPEPDLLEKENEMLKKRLALAESQLRIFNDNRLLQLFEKVKGRKDVVENAGGENFNIVYNSPFDVLIALIYGTKLN